MQRLHELELNKAVHILASFHGGSRATVNPPPVDTDDDYFVLYEKYHYTEGKPTLDELLTSKGFTIGGSMYLHHAGISDFQSWKKDDLNILVTTDANWYEAMHRAMLVCKYLNVKDKTDRINVHQMIVYGNDVSEESNILC